MIKNETALFISSFNGYVVLDLGYLLLETLPGGEKTNAAFGVFYFF